MLGPQRRSVILERLRHDGQVIAKALSEEMGLSEDTIRRDLRELAAEGLLQRVHGGALPASPAVAPIARRREVEPEGKDAIARAAAAMVRRGQVVFIDGGTTAVKLARALPRDLPATVVTHSPEIAVALADHDAITVEIVGGRLFRHSMVAVGVAAAEAVSRYRPDVYFMGVTGVHPDAGLTTGDAEEAAMKRAISRAAGETVVLASREKVGAASPFLVVPATEASSLVVERGTEEAVLTRFRSLGVPVILA
jgi:DeoR/GlpR family transcriptional regulator of sugar metabolism